MLPWLGIWPLNQIQAQVDVTQLELLVSRLDGTHPGLIQVLNDQVDKEEKGRQLLAYFRKRDGVKHPVERSQKLASRGMEISEKVRKIADDALRHVFVGQPAYPSHFCGDDIDWATSPVPDKEWVWQLNRMNFWNAMSKMYWSTGEEKYAEEWCLQVLDWIRKNPHDQAHDYAWRSIEAGIRGHSWTALYQYFIDAPSFTPEVLIAFLNSCYDHASFLMSVYRTGSNWGLMEAEGLAHIAILFPEFKEAVAWRTEAFRRFNNEITKQVYPDGHQRELAISYHLGCIDWFWRTYELARINGLDQEFPSSYLEKIERMCEVPLKLSMPDGRRVPFGDAWMGQPGQHKKLYETWADRFGRPDFLYLASDGLKGVAPKETAFALPESGLYSMRSGWDKQAICLVLKCGPDGGGHCQPDNGTFDLYAGGRYLMPDAGSYIYSGDPEGRSWFRQSKIHQTLTIDGANTKYAPKLRLWQPSQEHDILVVENQSYDQLKHRRAVVFVDHRYFIIIDEALGQAVGEVDIHFQLAPGKMVLDEISRSVRSDFPEGWNVLIKPLSEKLPTFEEERGQISYIYTQKEDRPAFRYRISKEGMEPVRFVTLVAPYEAEIPELDFRFIGPNQIGAQKIKFAITEDGKERYFEYELD